MMKKRMGYSLAALLAVAILCGMLCGCASKKSEQAAAEQDVSMTTLRFPLIIGGELPGNWDKVEQACNAYLKEKLHLQLEFVQLDADTLVDYYLLQAPGEETVDFVNLLSAENYLSQMVEAGVLMPLNTLLAEKGQAITEIAGDCLAAGNLGGTQYMIPSVKDAYSFGCSVECNAALVKKYGIDMASVHNLEDLEEILALLHEKEPDVISFAGNSTASGNTTLIGGVDRLTDSFGVLEIGASGQEDDAYTVVDWYETDRFMEVSKMLYSWYQKGYISSEILTTQRSASDLVREGEAFCCLSTIGPGADEGTDATNGGNIVEAALEDVPQLLTSNELGLSAIGISGSCKEPEKAMELLCLLYTDDYLVNLLSYGLENENYTLSVDGKVDQQGEYFLLYNQPMNQTLKNPLLSNGSDYQSYVEDFLDGEVRSLALGFVFDQRPVKEEIAACEAVTDKYFPVIDSGCVDPEKEIPKFVEALKEAGIDRILEEKQEQLDRWRSGQ